MAKKLTIISEHSEETATDILEILETNNISYYITPAGGYIRSLEALWIHDDSDFLKANELLSKYFYNKKFNYSNNSAYLDGQANKSTFQKIFSNPTTYALYIPTIVVILLMVFLLS
jgi:hypothetical protein